MYVAMTGLMSLAIDKSCRVLLNGKASYRGLMWSELGAAKSGQWG